MAFSGNLRELGAVGRQAYSTQHTMMSRDVSPSVEEFGGVALIPSSLEVRNGLAVHSLWHCPSCEARAQSILLDHCSHFKSIQHKRMNKIRDPDLINMERVTKRIEYAGYVVDEPWYRSNDSDAYKSTMFAACRFVTI